MDRKEILKRSVDSLQRIYAVVIALAITIAVQKLIFSSDGHAVFFLSEKGPSLSTALTHTLPTFIAFIAIVVPFYHGMNRHLDRAYIEQYVSPQKEGFLVLDFFLFFIEACLFVGTAALLTTKTYAFVILMPLLFIDTLWALISYGIHYTSDTPGPMRWVTINTITMIILWLFYFSNWFPDSVKSWTLCLAILVRSAADYLLCWRFYFPLADK